MLRPGPDYFRAVEHCVAAAERRTVVVFVARPGNDRRSRLIADLAATLATTPNGPRIEQRVFYSNFVGFAPAQAAQLIDALGDFGLWWIELSRHHPLQAGNDAIMRFRPDARIADAATFAHTAQRIAARPPVRLVCIVQRGGVDNADAVAQYIAWARSCAAHAGCFS